MSICYTLHAISIPVFDSMIVAARQLVQYACRSVCHSQPTMRSVTAKAHFPIFFKLNYIICICNMLKQHNGSSPAPCSSAHSVVMGNDGG